MNTVSPEAVGLGMGLAFFAFMALIVVFALACLAFWIWMLVDCAQSPEKPGSNDKVVWILVLVFTGWIGALIYFFVERRPRVTAGRYPASAGFVHHGGPPPPPPAFR